MTKLIGVEFNCCVKSRHTVFKTQTHKWTHSNARTGTICKGHERTIADPEPSVQIWKLQYSSQHFSSRLLSCAASLFSPHLTRAARPALTPPTSGAFSMALNAMPPYFIEHFVGWCWSPPQCLAMNSCIRDVRCGRRLERVWKKILGGRVFLSVLVSCIEVVVI